jgi:hypothetical protein
MPDAVTLRDAARALGLSVRVLHRDLSAGAPVVRRGARGRGRSTLIDVEAFAAWRRARDVARPDDRLLVLAADVPNVIADAMHAAFLEVDGPHKRACAGALAGAGYMAIVATLDRMRADAERVPELATLPQKIEHLRSIFGDSGKLDLSSTHKDT